MAEQLKKDYKQALKALRPKGKIWQVKDGSLSDQELDIEADMFAKVQIAAEKLSKESNLLTTEELLPDWEDVFELPHEGSYEERIAALNAENQEGQLSRPQYIELCGVLGVVVEIEEHYPFRCGLSRCGSHDELGSPKMVFWWDVIIKKATSDAAIDRMKSFINKYKQSHTKARFIDERTK